MAIGDRYSNVLHYAEHHAHAPLDKLVIQSICAGIWVGIAGHAATASAGAFYRGPEDAAIARFVHATLFPIAIWGIFLTGAELYTGNTMAMTVHCLHRKTIRSVLDLIRVFTINTLGNLAGCLMVVIGITWASGVFHPEANANVNGMVGMFCSKKLSHTGFLAPFVLGVAANFFVCTAVFAALIIEEAIGKLVALWFFVAIFCYASMEHIVANFYLASLCSFIPPYSTRYPFPLVVLRNFVPVWLGNTFAGCVLTGAVWWYVFKPEVKKDPLLPTPSEV